LLSKATPPSHSKYPTLPTTPLHALRLPLRLPFTPTSMCLNQLEYLFLHPLHPLLSRLPLLKAVSAPTPTSRRLKKRPLYHALSRTTFHFSRLSRSYPQALPLKMLIPRLEQHLPLPQPSPIPTKTLTIQSTSPLHRRHQTLQRE